MSVWVNEKTCPTCSDPLAVSGGVSMENTSDRSVDLGNRYSPASSHTRAHLTSVPSNDGRSGMWGGVSGTGSAPRPGPIHLGPRGFHPSVRPPAEAELINRPATGA